MAGYKRAMVRDHLPILFYFIKTKNIYIVIKIFIL